MSDNNSLASVEIINRDEFDDDLCTVTSTETASGLEEEYKKFEIFLANIEKGSVSNPMDSANCPNDSVTQATDLNNQQSPNDFKCCAQTISMDVQVKAVHKVSFFCHFVLRQRQLIEQTSII